MKIKESQYRPWNPRERRHIIGEVPSARFLDKEVGAFSLDDDFDIFRAVAELNAQQ